MISSRPPAEPAAERVAERVAVRAERVHAHLLRVRFAFFCLLCLLYSFPSQAAFKLDVREVTPGVTPKGWLIEDHSQPTIILEFSFAGGALKDPSKRLGLAHLAASLLDEGAGARDAEAFRQALHASAAQFSCWARRGDIRCRLTTLRVSRKQSLALIAQAFLAPRFDLEAIHRVRGQILASLAREEKDPHYRALRSLRTTLYPRSPYSQPYQGTPENLKTITPEDLRRWAQRTLVRARLSFAAVGDITAAELQALFEENFAALPQGQGAQLPAPPPLSGLGREVALVQDARPDTVFALAAPGLARDDPDYETGRLLVSILGGDFSGRLYAALRENAGLVYGISVFMSATAQGETLLQARWTSANTSAQESLALVRRVWQDFGNSGPSAQELADAKSRWLGELVLALAESANVPAFLLDLHSKGLTLNYLQNLERKLATITLKDAQAVARRLFDPQHLLAVFVGG